jgi:asparagine synthetase B (glutamine-hydrolysing)
MCNGEIYNSEILIQQMGLQVPEGASDCAVIPALLERGLPLREVVRLLDGEFAIVLVEGSTVTATRDPYGVRPLYFVSGGDWFGLVSDKAALTGNAEPLPTGTLVQYNPASQEIWHQPPWLKIPFWRSSVEGLTQAGAVLRHALEEAIYKRLPTQDVGVYMTGGLGSALIAAIAARRVGSRLHTYGPTDPSIRSVNHPLSDLEAPGPVKVILTEEGIDAIFGATGPEFEAEVDRRLRSPKIAPLEEKLATVGIETRSPFLDRQFVAVARSLPTDVLQPRPDFMPMTILRLAFSKSSLLPDSILWAPTKEA